MRLTKVLLCSAATAVFTLAMPGPSPIGTLSPAAQAATDVSISIGTFYDDLAPYGSWTQYDGNYVFVPTGVSASWRPYTAGHWVYTQDYGWLWVSSEPFGWATYHYGRWGHSDDVGWYWVPGRRWAPAWVSWRRSKGYVVWAPLPPRVSDDVSVEISVSDIPDRYWVAVPSRNFLDVDLSVAVVVDDHERTRVVEQARPVGNVRIENNVIVNNVIDVDYVRQATKQDVKPVEVKKTDDPRQAGKGSDGEVAVFNGEVSEKKGAKPASVKDVEEVKKERSAQQNQSTGGGQPEQQPSQGQTGTQPSNGEQAQPDGQEQTGKKGRKEQPQTGQEQQGGKNAVPEQAQPQQGEEQPIKKKRKTNDGAAQPEGGAQPRASDQEQPTKKKRKTNEGATQPEGGAQPQATDQEQPTKKKRKTNEGATQPEGGAQSQATDQEQPTKKKRKPNEGEAQPEGTQPQATEQEQQPTKKRRTIDEGAAQPKGSGEVGQSQDSQDSAPAGQRKKRVQPEQQPGGQATKSGCDQATGEGCAQ